MALSALFLMFFLLQHLTINMFSVISPELFNEASQFMGTNFLVQAILQPILMAGVIFHFGMGFYLEAKNRGARSSKYAMYKGSANASWMSRNMLWTGLAILLFLLFHLNDFWLHEITVKYLGGDMSGLVDKADPDSGYRYHGEVVAMFEQPARVGVYILSFIFLALHLQHGFASAFQSVGLRNKQIVPTLQKIGTAYSVLVPLGFIFIALYHHFA